MPEHKEITIEQTVISETMGVRFLFFILGFLYRGNI